MTGERRPRDPYLNHWADHAADKTLRAHPEVKQIVVAAGIAAVPVEGDAFYRDVGVGATLLPGALAGVAQDAETITFEMLDAAQAIAGITFTREEQQRILERLNGDRSPLPAFEVIRDAGLGNDTQPAFVFNPVPPGKLLPSERRPLRREPIDVTMPTSDEELAFLPLTHLSRLLETRQIRSTELTELYLARLKEHDPKLFCVVNLTEDIARRQARQADEEIGAGNYRGPLHGIPWGLKDLLAVRGTKTTWGMTPFRDRVIDVDSTVYERLTEAGAVLVAKLSTGALATTARWYGGLTRNPWNTEQDAAGSSAGPGSATAAGLVGFSIGTDTGGSVIGPSTRNGLTGLRPTFGRVSRYGGMVLAWTQDTVGPMCRSAEDCALVFDAIYGPDGRDNTVLDVPFNWDAMADPTQLRVGYLRSEFEAGPQERLMAHVDGLVVGGDEVRTELLEATLADEDTERWRAAAAALALLETPSAQVSAQLYADLHERSDEVRAGILAALAMSQRADIDVRLTDALKKKGDPAQMVALATVGGMRWRPSLPTGPAT